MPRLLAPDISTFPADDAHLVGSRCADCDAVTFPAQPRCPSCGQAAMAEIPLPRRGTVVAWTTQDFHPGEAYAGDTVTDFEPFGVGLVQLGDVVKVEARLTEHDPARLHTGMAVELTFVPLYTDVDGDEVMTFAFTPV